MTGMMNSDTHSVRKQAKTANMAAQKTIGLRSLDGKKIAVHLVVNGKERLVHGVGAFGLDARLGGVLRVQCNSIEDDFELLICENEWQGLIKPGEAFGCDYVLRLVMAAK